jgi:hypothetical protein
VFFAPQLFGSSIYRQQAITFSTLVGVENHNQVESGKSETALNVYHLVQQVSKWKQRKEAIKIQKWKQGKEKIKGRKLPILQATCILIVERHLHYVRAPKCIAKSN